MTVESGEQARSAAQVRRKLLIVDDVEPQLNALARAFRPYAESLEVIKTRNGLEGACVACLERPAGALIDVQLGLLSGLEVIAELKRHDEVRGMVLIAISAFWTPQMKENAIRVGATACVDKPVRPEEVLSILARHHDPRSRSSADASEARGSPERLSLERVARALRRKKATDAEIADFYAKYESDGATDEVVASGLGKSVWTFRHQLQRLRTRIPAFTFAEAVAWVRRNVEPTRDDSEPKAR
jgi:ActR/RegA family two-component response regulator